MDQALAVNLAVVMEMHAYDELATNLAAQRDRFAALRMQIAARYQSRPDTVAFELLNEPNGQLDTTWNDVMLPAIRAVRATNPRRLLIIASVFCADSRARLVAAVRQACETAGIGWAIWEDPVNMQLFDSRAGTWLTAIVDELLPAGT